MFAVITLIGTAVLFLDEGSLAEKIIVLVVGCAVAITFFGIGRALRYIFAGSK